MNLLIVILLFGAVNSLSILGLFPYAGKSHFLVYEPLLQELARRGHQVTVLSEFPQAIPTANYTDIVLEKTANAEVVDIDALPAPWLRRYVVVLLLAEFAKATCEKLSQKPVQELMNTTEKYDLILIEYFNTDCFLGFAHKFKTPFIGLSSCYQMPWHLERLASPDNPAYMPVHFADNNAKMGFLERVENVFMYMVDNALYYVMMEMPSNTIAKKYFGRDLPPLSSIARNTSAFLVNTFFPLNGVQPKVPGLVEVGGMNIGNPKPVTGHIEKWINESDHGVIYFSMGSMIKGHTFPVEKRAMFQKAFARLKQRVLWKWENETMPDKPDNVMIQKWMPQLDILCHPNVKAFITHGGLLGTTEAVHCGVPSVVMPQFGDQYTNARALEASGGGIILHFSTITEEDVYNALKTVLDPSFNKKAKELSVRFKDRPMPPMETAIYWVEYVARHKGAPHLRSAAVGMPYYQYLLLDVIAFLLLVSFAIGYVFYVVTRFTFRRLFRKQVKEKKN